MLSACGKVQNAEKAIEKIGEVTVDSGPQIEAAEQALADLNADQKAKVSNLNLFDNAKLKYAEVLEIQRINNEKVERVETIIQNIQNVTIDSWDAISAARQEYDKLDSVLQESVSNKDTLFEAESTFENMAVQTITDAIDQIGSVSLDSEDDVLNARRTYESFDENIQRKVENSETLFAAEDKLIQLKIDRAQSAIAAIGSDITLESKDAIFEAANALLAVPATEREKVNNRDALTEARNTYNALLDEQRRQKEIEEAKNIIRVTKVAVSAPDSVGGVELYFNFVNNSDKTIKYLHFGVTFYNAVNDVVLPNYNKQAINYCQETGPYKKGEGLNGTNWYWGKYYSFDIKTVKLVNLSIEYMDGTTITLSNDQIAAVQY